MVMIVTALAAAVLYGAGAAVEQRQAAAAPESAAGRPRLLLLLARQPLWLAGIGAQVGGFAAHAVALRSGPLATVQMLVAGELIVAVVIVRAWSGRPLSRASWAAALAVALAVAAFLAVTAPGHHHLASHPDHNVAAALGAAVSGGGALVAAAVGLRAAGRSRAVLLAVAAGLADTCSAVVTMAFSHVASHGPAALLTSWTVYAVAVCGAGNVLLTQTAYQVGRPMITLPVIAAVTPVTSVAIGIGLLGETPRTGVAGVVIAGAAVLVASVALACLARSAPHAEPRAESHAELRAESHAELRAESHAEPRAQPHAEPRAQPHAEPRAQPHAELRAQPHAGPRAQPHSGCHPGPQARRVAEAEREGVTISPSLAIRLRADRRMLPAHSRDDRP